MPDLQQNSAPLSNPNADSDFLATDAARQQENAAMTFVRSVESAGADQRREILANAGYSEEEYAARKARLATTLAGRQSQYEQADAAAGAHVQNLETATDVASGAAKGLNIVGGAAVLQSLGVPAPSAIAGGAILDRVQNYSAEKAIDMFRYAMGGDHPYIEPIAGLIGAGLSGGALLGAIPGAIGGSAARAAEQDSAAGAASKDAGAAKDAAGAAEGDNPPARPETPPATESTSGGESDATEPAVKRSDEGPAASTTDAGAAVSEGNSNAAAAPVSDEHRIADMIETAKAAPMTPEEVGGLQLSGEGQHALLATPVDANDTLRLHYYAADQVSQFMDAFRAAKDTGDPAAQARSDELFSQLTSTTMPRWRAALHQAGLGLRVLGSPNEPSTQQMRDVFDVISNAGDAPDRMAKALGDLPTVAERAELLTRSPATDWTMKGALYNLYLNSILSVNSAGMKAASDAANIIWQVPTRALAEYGSRGAELASGNDSGSMGVAPGSSDAVARGMFDGFGRALKYGLASWADNKPAFEGDVGFIDNPMPRSVMAGSGFENSWWGKGIDLFGHMISIPSRSILAIDQFSKSLQYDMEMAAIAHQQGLADAAGEGLTGAEAAARGAGYAQGYMRNPADWMVDRAMGVAKTNTFTADLEGSLGMADKLRQSSYALRTLMPFVKTPVNLTLQGIRQSPLAPLSGTWRGAVAGGGADSALATSKAALGTAILGYLTKHVLEGNIVGGVPENLPSSLKDEWLKDNQPYSIKAGTDENGNQRWVSYRGVQPLSWLLEATADATPAYSYWSGGEAEQAKGALLQAVTSFWNQQPMWGALHLAVDALDESDKGKTDKLAQFFGRQLEGPLVPGSIANFAEGEDPVKRQTFTMLDELRSRVPYLRKGGLPTLDPFGQPVIVPPGFMWNEFPAFKLSSTGADPVADEMIRLHGTVGFKPPEPPQSIGGAADQDNLDAPTDMVYGAALSPAERNRFMELRGAAFDYRGHHFPSLRDDVASLMAHDEYKGASDAMQAQALHDVFIAHQQAAEARMLAENPGLVARVQGAYQAKAAAMAPRKTASNLVAP